MENTMTAKQQISNEFKLPPRQKKPQFKRKNRWGENRPFGKRLETGFEMMSNRY